MRKFREKRLNYMKKTRFVMQMWIAGIGRGSLRDRKEGRDEFLASRWHPNDVPSDSGVDAWRRGSLAV